MKKVVDANFLRQSALEDYLRKDSRNHVVFTDYVSMECYKGTALENIRRSLEIVSKYPEQVIVLKGTREIIRLQASGEHTLADFIDSQQTDGFREFCRHVRAAVRGDAELMPQLVDLGKMADAHLKQMRDDASGFSEAIRQIAQSFSPGQLAELRGGGALSKETGDLIIRNYFLGHIRMSPSCRPQKNYETLWCFASPSPPNYSPCGGYQMGALTVSAWTNSGMTWSIWLT